VTDYTVRRERGTRNGMTLTPVATTEAVLGHHLQCFGAGDLDGILSDYAPDAVMCAPNGTDTFVVRNGKIVAQTFAGKITPKT
jgi:hypothetical protein